ncbi:MAG TPA: FxLYD domain-containing protein [Methylomirabilota bacterium]|nr:FxLYD domain-containing protein [Methylomirabilota bacterium]
MKPRTLAVALLLCLVAGAGAALAQSDADRYFGLEWAGGERRGRPNVSGYIVNQYRIRATNIRLLVESLDASGKVLATNTGYVSDVPAGGRVYFETSVKEKAPRYRVTIVSWDWREGGGL